LPSFWSLVGGYLFGEGADLRGVDLTGLDLSDVDVSGVVSGGITGRPEALPDGVKIIRGHIVGGGARLDGVDLSGTDLRGVSLRFCNLTNTDVSGATWDDTTTWPKQILSGQRSIRPRSAAGAEVVSVALSSGRFRRWFGDSKIVDAAGRPLVVYHGTDTGYFRDEANADSHAFAPAPGALGEGIYFTPSAAVASGYAARQVMQYSVPTGLVDGEFPYYRTSVPNVIPVFLRMEKPLDRITRPFALKAIGILELISETHGSERARDAAAGLRKSLIRQLPSAHEGLGDLFWRARHGYDGLAVALNVAARRIGCDGIIANLKGFTEYVVFSPSQIKSAYGNDGSYDLDDPSIVSNPRRTRRGAPRKRTSRRKTSRR
jgi:hypothetical protein